MEIQPSVDAREVDVAKQERKSCMGPGKPQSGIPSVDWGWKDDEMDTVTWVCDIKFECGVPRGGVAAGLLDC
jgi:hypothetical protein